MNIHTNYKVGRTVIEGDTEYLFFSGTSYLGLSTNKAFHEKLKIGIDKYGSNYPISRISNLRFDIYDEFENHIKKYFQVEDCLSISSGFLAGKLLVEYYKDKGFIIKSPDVHPALWNAVDSISNQTNSKWAIDTINFINTSKYSTYIVLANSVSSLLGIIYSFEWLNNVNRDKKLVIVIDDSHGIGIIGENHKGIIELLPNVKNDSVEFIIIASLGKAMGVPGGLILGSKTTLTELRKSVFYTASSPIIPAYLYAYLESQLIRKNLTAKLFWNIAFFNKNMPIDILEIKYDFPVYLIENEYIYEKCLMKNILLSSFPYPNPNDKKITRIVLNALHEKTDLINLIDVLIECKASH